MAPGKHPRLRFVRGCPYCGSFEVRRSHRRGAFEGLVLPFLLLRPYRCEDCGRRHYNLFFSEPVPAGEKADKEID